MNGRSSEPDAGEVQVASVVHTGLRRERNDDRAWVHTEGGTTAVLAVADGMGGFVHGGDAATVAIDAVAAAALGDLSGEALSAETVSEDRAVAELDRLMISVDEEIRDRFAGRGGTTMIVAIVSPTALRLCHSGDSRAYLVRDGVLERLTTDHNLAALYVEAGRLRAEDADHHPSSSRLTSFLGAGADMKVDHRSLVLRDGDRVVLATDGLSATVPETSIAEIASQPGSPEDVVQWLCDAALEGGGVDNIAIVAAFV